MRSWGIGLLVVAGLLAFSGFALYSNWGYAFSAGGIVIAAIIGLSFVWDRYWSLRPHLERHLGPDWDRGEIIHRAIHAGDRVQVQAALDRLQADAGTPGPFGLIRGGGEFDGPSAGSLPFMDLEPRPIEYEPFPSGGGRTMDCAGNALYLVRGEAGPVAVLVGGGDGGGRLEVLAKKKAIGRAFLTELDRLMAEVSPYRGMVLSVELADRKTGDFRVVFHEPKGVSRSGIVLPDDVLEVIDRNVLGYFKHVGGLRRAGQGTRHGVLLHGPPGTGKTLVTRYLIGALAGVTVVTVTGKQYPYLRQACRLARLLAPSLIVLEDVDLVAADRVKNRTAPLLHELMDEMDGIGPESDCVFVLTTNRPEVLEPALAARPGRVDQAVFFPLPDAECRRRLFAQFGRGLEVAAGDLEPLVGQTEGASPAFLKEMFRRAALMALERGATGEPLPVRGEDFARALRELVRTGGPLTRRFLGFPAGEGGDASTAITSTPSGGGIQTGRS